MSSPISEGIADFDLRFMVAMACVRAARLYADIVTDLRFRAEILKTAHRIWLCANSRRLVRYTADDGSTRLHYYSNRACKIRAACPFCNRQQAKKHRTKVEALCAEALRQNPDAIPLFLTLTVKNRPLTVADTKVMHAVINDGLKRMFANPRVVAATLGQYSVIEAPIRGANGDQVGVHAHCLVLARPDYFDELYIDHSHWRALWKHSARLGYQPQVRVQRVRDHNGETSPDAINAAVRELCKYLSADFIKIDPKTGRMKASAEAYFVIRRAFHRRRIARYDRCFAAAAKNLRKRNQQPAD